jgi:hypothetical protein
VEDVSDCELIELLGESEHVSGSRFIDDRCDRQSGDR